jgi:uncharacterized membrane protein YgdD (TMEM256/DUF423 family)|tara:strand:+ start:1484 stop:1876 length:393 start_codon:yes stop_codon:yes gene_type:complete
MSRSILIKAGILGMIAVLGGAFGAHALKEVLSPEHLASFNTGVRYQMIHAVVLIGLFLLGIKFEMKQFRIAAQLIFWGVILFSGSIYLLTLKNIIGVEALKFAGPITPIGGLLIITGWLFMVLGAMKVKK